jgi:thiamine biosynthesis protein ThiS
MTEPRGPAVCEGGDEIVVNGERRTIAPRTRLLELLADLALDPRAVAVERNGDVLRRAELQAVELEAGDRLEIVRFVQGG